VEPGKVVKEVIRLVANTAVTPFSAFLGPVEKPVGTKMRLPLDTISTGIFWEIDVCMY